MDTKKYKRLDKDDCACLLVDHQTGLFSLVSDFEPIEFKNNVLATAAGAQLLNWFAVACELHRDWRNDMEGLAGLCAKYLPSYANLITSKNYKE